MGLDSLTRRNFLKLSALAALAGCKSPPKSSLLTTLVDAPSKVRIIYLPDSHNEIYNKMTIEYLPRFWAKNKVDAIALEGLVGEIGGGYLEKIKAAYAHRSHTAEYCRRVMREVERMEYDKRYKMDSRYALHPVEPILPCCQVDYTMIRAPGLPYAMAFNGKIPLFGMEDYDLHERSSRLYSLYYEMSLSEDCQNPNEDPRCIEIIAKYYPLDEYAKSKDIINKELSSLPGNTECKFGRFLHETILDKRSAVAVENILKRQSEGTVLLIMGRDHGEGIRKACEEKGISLQLLEDPPL
jgi:hypothetical protein